MKILGIETSCDETAAAVVEDGHRLLSNVIASSADLHVQYGGVVPEIAARSHIESILPVIQQALDDAACTWDDIDAIAVTYGAGLGGSLLIGVLTARTLAIAKNKPLYACNHVLGHVYANFLTDLGPHFTRHPELVSGPPSQSNGVLKRVQHDELVYAMPKKQPEFPLMAIIVSGKHSQLAIFKDHFDYTLLGETFDDAIGEAFDKVAKMLGLPYPGGPSVSKAAENGNPHAFALPKAKMGPHPPRRVKHGDEVQGSSEERKGAVQLGTASAYRRDDAAIRAVVESGKYDFSFSGLKTAVLRLAQAQIGESFDFPSFKLPERLSEAQKADIAASFQRVAIETIVDKAVVAYNEFQPKSVVIAGGVAANQELRRQLSEALPLPLRQGSGGQVPIDYPDLKLCTDNGAMIATLGCFMASTGQPEADPYCLEIQPNLSM